MKKIILTFNMVMVALGMAAVNYDAMFFSLIEGNQKSISAKNLVITFSDNELCAQNDTESINIPLSELVSMHFGEYSASVENMPLSKNLPLYVFSTSGIFEGKFESLEYAIGALENGIYVIRNSEGETYKITVKK